MNNIIFENQFATLTQTTKAQGVDIVTITHELFQASISLYGGQLLSFLPTGQRPIFWLSDTSSYQQGKAIRGGVPLCWPWFGANDKQSPQEAIEQPAGNHGFARQVQWRLAHIAANKQGVTIELTFQGENQHFLWPQACSLTQTFNLSTVLHQCLAMQNDSTQDVEYTGALHSYFSVSNPKNAQVSALNEVLFFDKLTSTSNNQQVLNDCCGPLDRVYESGEPVTLIDKGWQRAITIESNAQQWVLWNPGKDVAQAMVDVHQNGEQEYVCLEAANTQWQVIPAGKSLTLEQKISVINLND